MRKNWVRKVLVSGEECKFSVEAGKKYWSEEIKFIRF